MEVILPSAISQDGDAPTYASFDRQTADARQPEVMQVKEVSQKPALIPAAKLVEKKVCNSSRTDYSLLINVSAWPQGTYHLMDVKFPIY